MHQFKKEASEKTKLTMVVALTASQVLHESLDDLVDTDFYKMSLKQTTNRMQKELERVCDRHIDLLWAGDEKKARLVQDGLYKIAKKIATMKPSELVVIGDMFENGNFKFVEEGKAKEILLTKD